MHSHLPMSFSSVHDALRGDVDGSDVSMIPVVGKTSFLYSFDAVFPFVNTAFTDELSMRAFILFGIASSIDASSEPSIVHSPMTSHSAMPCLRRSAFFSSMLSETG